MAPLPVTRPRCSPGGSVTCIHVTCIAARADRLIPPGVRIALVGQMGHSSANAQSSKSPQFKPAKPGGFAGRAARSAEGDGWGPREFLGIRLGGTAGPAPFTAYSSPGASRARPIVAVGKGGAGCRAGFPIMLGAGWGTSRPREWGMVLRRGHPCLGCDNIAKRRGASRAQARQRSYPVVAPKSSSPRSNSLMERCKVARGASVGME